MSEKKFYFDINLQDNEVNNLKADTLDITSNLASANTKRIVYWSGQYYYSDGTNWIGMNTSGSAGGDLNGTYPNPTVDGLQGNPVSNVAPANGQTLQWNGSAWIPGAIPSGGSGGGGVVYYLNYQNTTDISPTTGLPTSPVAPSQLGISYSVGAGSITSANLTQGSYSLICGFVTIVGTPGVTDIPAGLWDFNIWIDIAGSGPQANQTQFQVRIYKYDSTAGTYTSLANSDDVYVYDPVTIAQYIANVTMPQTTILSTDRIYVELWAQKNVNQSRQIRFYFDSLYPSHVHTTIPSVAGSGVVKVVNGVFQSPASTIVDADVSATAAIAVSKLSMSTAKILGRTTAGSGSVEEITVASSLGYTPENVANKENTTLDTSTTKYPTNNLVKTNIDTKAALSSPAFTGVPTAPTAAAGTNTTQLATTAFVTNAVSKQPEAIQAACSDETTALSVGAGRLTFRAPFAITLTSVRISCTTAPTGAAITVNVKKNGFTIFSTKPQIAAGATTSVGGAVPGVLSTTAIADDDILAVDIDQIGSTVAGTGLKITFLGTRT